MGKPISTVERDDIRELSNIAIEDTEYINFCEKYIYQNFETLNTEELEHIYEIGNGLLLQYLTKNKNINYELIQKIQYIITNANFHIWNKKAEDIEEKSKDVNQKLERNIDTAETFAKDLDNEKGKLNELSNSVNSMTTNIITIVLTISIIPTAIAGIEHINPNYILPFLSSIVLFGMIMIMFVCTTYRGRIRKLTMGIFLVMLILTVAFWIFSCMININKISDDTKIAGKIQDTQQVEDNIENINNQETSE